MTTLGNSVALAVASLLLVAAMNAPAAAPKTSPDQSFPGDYPSAQASKSLKDELLYQRAVQAYLWALPALNMYGMKEGSEKTFGQGYNVLPIFKERLNAKTLITTPNSDVIYALGFLDLAQTGPMVIDVPPGLQGIIDDHFQRPICSEGNINGKQWCGDVGLPGPDAGKGGKYLVLPPDYHGDVPKGFLPYRSRTYGVFVFWRGFFQDPTQLDGPVKVMEQTKIYPLGKEASAKPMQFPDASKTPANMLYPRDGSAYDMLSRYIDHEYVDPQDMEMRGIVASLGIVKGQPFKPDAHEREILDRAAKTAFAMTRVIAFRSQAENPGAFYYPDRHWVNPFPDNAAFTAPSYNQIDPRIAFFAIAYSTSPGMAIDIQNVGAKYPSTFWDSQGHYLAGASTYKLHLPKDIPAALFWSVTAYDPVTGSGLDNGQPFPSLNSMDKPAANPDGSTDIFFGPSKPAEAKNWLRTVPGKGFFLLLRLYGPKAAFFDKTWKPDDLVKIK